MRILTRLAVMMLVLPMACGGGNNPDPTDVDYGETTLIVLVNPRLNELNQVQVPAPGTARSGVTITLDQGGSATSDDQGIAIIRQVPPGRRTLEFSGMGTTGTVTIDIADKDLVELAVAVDGNGAGVMAETVYPFGGTVVEVDPTMAASEANQALAQSHTVVFFKTGTFTGDLVFAGSNSILFGAGLQGGEVTLDGNITVEGSSNRIRGATVTGTLKVTGSDFGLAFSWLEGAVTIDASSVNLLYNQFCSTLINSGSDLVALENLGLAPLPDPSGC